MLSIPGDRLGPISTPHIHPQDVRQQDCGAHYRMLVRRDRVLSVSTHLILDINKSSPLKGLRCKEFAARGCVVYATARRVEAMNDLRAPNIHKLRLDVTKGDEVQAVVREVVEWEGQIDVVVNNAGYSVTSCVQIVMFP